MLFIFISLVVLIPTFWGWGSFFEKFLGSFFDGISTKIVLGIVGITVFLTLVSFCIPLTSYLEVFLIFGGLFFFIYFKNYKNLRFKRNSNHALFFLTLFIVIIISSYYPIILDHFGYYVPTIHWLQEYGLIKGITNVEITLAQASFWHIFQAGFSHISDVYLRINTLIFVVFLMYIFERKQYTMLVISPFLFFFSQSPSPDLPAIIISLIVFSEVWKGNKNYALLFTFAVYVFALKPTMIWLPIFVFLMILKEKKFEFNFFLFPFFILILYAFKNLYVFGYPFFPTSFLDLSLAWKPHPEIMNQSAKFAIEKTFDMQYSFDEIQKFGFWEAAKNWLTLSGIKGFINYFFIITLLFLGVFSWVKKDDKVWMLFFSIVIKSVIVIWFSAQYRFFLDVFFVVFVLVFYDQIKKIWSVVLFLLLSTSVLFFYSFPNTMKQIFPSFRNAQYMLGFQSHQLIKPSYFELKNYDSFQIGNFRFNVVKDFPFDFDTPIPALAPEYLKMYDKIGIFPQKNTENIKDGFYWKKMSEKEKIRLKKIIDLVHPKLHDQ